MDLESFYSTMWITAKLACITTILLFVIALPISYRLAYSQSRMRPIFEALIAMPMVLPPSVIGYYLLVLYSPQHWVGSMLQSVFDIRLAFSFTGVVLASVLFNMPFMIQPLLNGFRALPDSLREASYTLGKSKLQTFRSVLLPNIQSSVITAIALTFAHTIGEFGIVLMVGGNMPGETRVASIAIYDEVQSLNFDTANMYALILFVVSFVLLSVLYAANSKKKQWTLL